MKKRLNKQINWKLKRTFKNISHYRVLFVSVVSVLVLYTAGYVIINNRVFADTLLEQFITALKDKMGFEYDLDPNSAFVFKKITPNYNAYSGDKQSNGSNRIFLERNGLFIEVKFASAEIYKDVQSPTILAPSQSTSSGSASLAKNNTAQSLLNSINLQIQAINSNINDITQKIVEIEKEVSSITSKGKMIAGERGLKVAFENLVYGTDVQYSLTEAGISQEIVIRLANKLKNYFTFSILMPDFTYKDVGKGVYYFFDKNGDKIMRVPKAWATDSNNTFTNDVEIKIETYLLVHQMTVKVPLSWLEDPKRVFPVTIHTAFEITPELRDGKSAPYRAPKDILFNASESAVLSATDSSQLAR